MPTYQYLCTECDHAFEQVQSFRDDALTACPSCEGRLRKVFNSVGVVFKGSGFYKTDSRSSSTATSPAASTESTSPAAASSSSDSGSSTPAKATTSSSSSSSRAAASPA